MCRKRGWGFCSKVACCCAFLRASVLAWCSRFGCAGCALMVLFPRVGRMVVYVYVVDVEVFFFWRSALVWILYEAGGTVLRKTLNFTHCLVCTEQR